MSDFKMKGTITKIGDVQEGTSKAGKAWKKTNVVIDNGAEWGNVVSFTVFGDEKVENLLKYNKVGQEVEISFNVSSKEYEGKFYSDISAWKIFGVKKEGAVAEPAPSEDDDLPF